MPATPFLNFARLRGHGHIQRIQHDLSKTMVNGLTAETAKLFEFQ